ncbi:LOW QUALITY PROTEIN: MORN repeat-containing protein 2 [Theristicus caerulescens]
MYGIKTEETCTSLRARVTLSDPKAAQQRWGGPSGDPRRPAHAGSPMMAALDHIHRVLNISMDGDSTSPLGNLCQVGVQSKKLYQQEWAIAQVTGCFGCVRTPPDTQKLPWGCFLRVLLQTATGPLGSALPHASSPPPPQWGSLVVEERVTGVLLAHTLCMAPKGTCSIRACVLQGPISGSSLSAGDGESALGETALCNRRNASHDLIGLCVSDALCLEVKIPVFHHCHFLEGECKRTPEGVLERNGYGVHTSTNRTTYVSSWKNYKVILSSPSFKLPLGLGWSMSHYIHPMEGEGDFIDENGWSGTFHGSAAVGLKQKLKM